MPKHAGIMKTPPSPRQVLPDGRAHRLSDVLEARPSVMVSWVRVACSAVCLEEEGKKKKRRRWIGGLQGARMEGSHRSICSRRRQPNFEYQHQSWIIKLNACRAFRGSPQRPPPPHGPCPHRCALAHKHTHTHTHRKPTPCLHGYPGDRRSRYRRGTWTRRRRSRTWYRAPRTWLKPASRNPREPAMSAIQKGTRVLISLCDSLMFGRVPGTRPNIANPIAR